MAAKKKATKKKATKKKVTRKKVAKKKTIKETREALLEAIAQQPEELRKISEAIITASKQDVVSIYWGDGTYTGEVVDGVPHGQGLATVDDPWPNSGDMYVGGFKDGDRHGHGTFTQSDGFTYTGEYRDDDANGQGTCTLPDGTKYVGEWKYNEANGQGTEIYPDGSKYVGEFKENNAWQGTEYDKGGNVTATYSSGIRKAKR